MYGSPGVGSPGRSSVHIAMASALLLGACGANGEDSTEPTDGFSIDGECLNCGREAVRPIMEQLAPSDRVWVTPSDVSFYGDASLDDAPDVMTLKTVSVRNTTIVAIQITQVTIVDNPFGLGGPGGSDYFQAPVNLPVEVGARSGTVDVPLGYLGSREQRSAYAFISTTHPAFPTLVVAMTGKIFTGFDF